MILIIGLGNPGEKYKSNRHNVGYLVVDILRSLVKSKELIVKKTGSFMNNSGSFVKHFISLYPNIPISSLYVIHDDLDIKLGEFKIQFGKGPKDHNGLKSVDNELKTDQYWHVRVGVENRHSEITESISRGPVSRAKHWLSGGDYVLSDFTEEEKVILNGVIKQICNQLVKL